MSGQNWCGLNLSIEMEIKLKSDNLQTSKISNKINKEGRVRRKSVDLIPAM
jgi:hypothetical protein